MTKALCLVSPDPSVITIYYPNLANTRDYANHGGLSRTALFYQVQESLERIGTTYVDVLQIHAFEPRTPIEETMRALNDLVISGKVRYLGACNIRAWQLAEMNSVAKLNKWTEFTSVQIEHSLLYRPEVFISHWCWVLDGSQAYGCTLGVGCLPILLVQRSWYLLLFSANGRTPRKEIWNRNIQDTIDSGKSRWKTTQANR